MNLRNGDRVALVGDSITAAGQYHLFLTDYYFTRRPKDKIRFYNLGISGGTANDANLRLDWDIQPKNCNKAFVMFGMNDIQYQLFQAAVCNQNKEQQKEAVKSGCYNIERLTEQIGGEIALMTPTPYEQLAELGQKNCFGADDSLKQIAAFDKKLAKEKGYLLIDLHMAMLRENTRLRKKEPDGSLVGADRIHPGILGHALIAREILKALGESETVSVFEYDMEIRAVCRMKNMRVHDLKLSEEGMQFIYQPNSLPLALDGESEQYLSLFNQEILRVSGLPKGKYRLLLDRLDAGTFTAAQLQKGIQLAVLEANPNLQRARYVHSLNQTRSEYEHKHRISKNFLIKLKAQKIDLTDKGRVEKAVESYASLYDNKEYYQFVKEMFYRFNMGTDKGFLEEMERMYQDIYRVNRPLDYRIELLRCI